MEANSEQEVMTRLAWELLRDLPMDRDCLSVNFAGCRALAQQVVCVRISAKLAASAVRRQAASKRAWREGMRAHTLLAG